MSRPTRRPALPVAVFDVCIPKRRTMEVWPELARRYPHPVATLQFLRGTFSRLRPGVRCEELTDEEIVREVLLRRNQTWKGRVCILFTVDQGFHAEVRHLIKPKTPLVIITIPLNRKPAFSGCEVKRILRAHVMSPLRFSYFESQKKEGRALAAYLRRRFPQ